MQKSMLSLLSVADLVSNVNAIFGFLAIIVLISDIVPEELRIRVSFSFILLALLADGLDGIVARRFKRSDVGEHVDSMADTVSMVIATSIFIFVTYQDYISCCLYRQIYVLIALVLFLSFGTIRLASFYMMKNKDYYVGLPAPASAIILLLLAFFEADFLFIFPVVIVIGAAMASNITFPKLTMKINAIATLFILLTLVMYDSYWRIAPLLLLISIIIYATVGPVYIKYFTKQ